MRRADPAERLREAQRAVDRGKLDFLQFGRGKPLLLLRVGQQRGVTGIGAPGVLRIAVRRLLVFDRRLGIACVLVQQFSEQEVVLRGLRSCGNEVR